MAMPLAGTTTLVSGVPYNTLGPERCIRPVHMHLPMPIANPSSACTRRCPQPSKPLLQHRSGSSNSYW